MLTLPNLAPQDSYTLWYSSRNCPSPHPICDQDIQGSSKPQQRRNQAAAYRSPLVILRFEEESIQHRKRNITDYGAAWLRPPGVPKSLHQLREDERELKEYQEALRRERLVQELAEAEAGAANNHELQPSEGLMGDMDEMQDLDDEIPEANLLHVNSESATEDEVDTDEDVESNYEASTFTPRGHIPVADDLIYDRLLHDDHDVVDEEQMSGMLLEEDLIQEFGDADQNDSTGRRDQDIDLDDNIPEAEEYEHTDTEEELCSSEINDDNPSLNGN
ncbi:hypothetical protein K3495_g1964 [Podosphaera aphanis]|nr:hypothetical protein K3495_g1964 [Podosphaera aphanis]